MVAPRLESERTSLAGSGVHVPPPPHFRPLYGAVRRVSLRKNPWGAASGDTLAKINGIRYEGKVQERLKEKFHDYLEGPALHFEDEGGKRFLVPDGLLLLPNVSVVVEIKSQHMPEAWWQLDQLYRPVVQALHPMRGVTCVEIVRSYDPSMPFPCPIDLITPDRITSYRGRFGVVIWRL